MAILSSRYLNLQAQMGRRVVMWLGQYHILEPY
jgi:hypothetical protein